LSPGQTAGRANLAQLAGPWWMFPVTGVAWLIFTVVVLRFSIGPGGARRPVGGRPARQVQWSGRQARIAVSDPVLPSQQSHAQAVDAVR
jgi:hypothetical protein